MHVEIVHLQKLTRLTHVPNADEADEDFWAQQEYQHILKYELLVMINNEW
jgi:hypothetical protein